MKRISKQLFLMVVSTLLFAGCNTYTDEGAEINQAGDENVRIQNFNEEYRSDSYNQTYRMRVDEDAEKQVTLLNEVQNATVITVGSKAYAAVVLEDGDTDGVPEGINKKISDQIKATDDSITEVYVSSNADFVVRMSDYRDQLQSRRPIIGLTEEFNYTIEKAFPYSR